MGLGIGYGLNDEPGERKEDREEDDGGIGFVRSDPLGLLWKRGLDAAASREQNKEQALCEEWAKEVMRRLPDAVRKAIARGERRVTLGNFRSNEIIPQGRGEFYPERTDLTGGALALYDLCAKEGLHLFIGGDFKMSGSYRAPFEIIVCLERTT